MELEKPKRPGGGGLLSEAPLWDAPGKVADLAAGKASCRRRKIGIEIEIESGALEASPTGVTRD